jgi:outer membrane protein insertion porin family
MRYKFVIIGLMAFLMTALAPVIAPAALSVSAYAESISRIVVEGNQRVEESTVLSYLRVKPGDAFDSEVIDESVKALFQTGLFADVQVFQRGSQLVIHVEENPMINRVNFEGNSEIKDSDLAKEIELRERMMFTRAKAQSDVQRVIALYRRTGYYNVTVSPKLIRLPENRVDLVFEINEGGETTIKEINFEGNNSFSDSDLRGKIVSSEHAWWKFLSHNDTYDVDRLSYDRELVRRYYLKNGFADIQVDPPDVRRTPDGKSFIITFTLIEGPRYKVADVAVNVGSAKLDEGGLRDGVTTGVGDTYDASKVDKTVENLTLEAARQGFVFAKVNPDIVRNAGQNTVDIRYDIVEGPRTYIERIDIIGNTRTEDQVIRRQLQLYEGDAFNRIMVDRARRRLTALDYFESIDFREDPGSAPDKVILAVVVKEKSTGQVNFSVGYSTSDGVIGSIGLQERNFMGKGQNVRLNTTLSLKRQQVDFSFTEPYFMGLPIAAGVDAFATRTDNQDISSYNSEQVGGALRSGFNLDEYSTISLKYGLEWQKITGVDTEVASPAVIESQGTYWKSQIGASYIWDNLDSPVLPTNGFRGEIDSTIAGLGGNTFYASLEAHGWYFIPIYEEKVVLKVEGNAGMMAPLPGHTVPLQDRFFMGGDTFRGFAKSGVGPRQINNAGGTDAIGGQTYAIGTVEMTFPLGIPEEWGMRGALFSDFGTIFNAPEQTVDYGTGDCQGSSKSTKNCTVFDTSAFRMSVGAGVIWQSPFGPLRFDLAYPLLKAKYDQTEWFQFSIGTSF